MTSSASAHLASWHGVAAGDVRFGVATWFGDVLVRFGYDLFEHEHPWDGEWLDDAFEAAAIDLRSTVAKLLRVLDGIDADAVDPEVTPPMVDLALSYLDRVRRDVTVAVPNCFGTEGRPLAGARGDPGAMSATVTEIDTAVAVALSRVASVDLTFATHAPDLFAVIDAARDRPPLPKATARLRATSSEVTLGAISRLDDALVVLSRAFDELLRALQQAVAARAEDGADLLDRWARTDWSTVCRATPGIARHLPKA